VVQVREGLIGGKLSAGKLEGCSTSRPARAGSGAGPNGSSPDPKEVRAWADANGIEVSKRGRIPSSLVVRFQEAQR
jgi:hypothetical protein